MGLLKPCSGCHLAVVTGLVCIIDPFSYAREDISLVGLTVRDR